MSAIKHKDFKRLLVTHELAFAADAGFSLPEHDMEIIIEALKIATKVTKPHKRKKRPPSEFKYVYHGFE